MPFLDIGKEGELKGQIKSVIRDLEIMIRITIDQKDTLMRFERALGHVFGPSCPVDLDALHVEVKGNMEDLEDMRKSAGDISTSVSSRRDLQTSKGPFG